MFNASSRKTRRETKLREYRRVLRGSKNPFGLGGKNILRSLSIYTKIVLEC